MPTIQDTTAFVLAAGLGTRLRPFTTYHPKALAPVGDKTLLEICLLRLKSAGITKTVINVHHHAAQILEALCAHRNYGMDIAISHEQAAPLETGGGLLYAAPLLADAATILMLNVDILSNIDLAALLQEHHRRKALATLAVQQRKSSRQLLFDDELQLAGWQNQDTGAFRPQTISPAMAAGLRRFAFSGIQVLDASILHKIGERGAFSIIDSYLSLAATEHISAYDHTGDILLDVGKPEALLQGQQLLSQLKLV